jgi:hypothetical protein
MWDIMGIVAAVVAIGAVFWLAGRLLKSAQAGDRSYSGRDSWGSTDAGE